MAWQHRLLGIGTIGVCGTLLAGCASDLARWAQPRESLSTHISRPGSAELRAQMPDAPKPIPLNVPSPDAPKPIQITMPPPSPNAPKPIQIIAPMSLETSAPKKTLQPIPIDKPGAIEQTSLSGRGTVRVRVRAWVNGRPIFDNEVMQIAGPELSRMPVGLSRAEQSTKMTDIVNTAIESLIDQELIYQDAVKKLEKNNPNALEKLKEFVDLEADKVLERMRNAKVPEADVREIEPTLRRMTERNLVSSEFARARIRPLVETRIGLQEIREYYETHLDEFLSEDRVAWKDVFIPLNPNQPTIESLTRFADELANKCRNVDDFNKLIAYDGLGKNGDGLGQRKGEIRPAELEKILFELEPGRIGPVVPFPTGVHLIWVTKREFKGQLPLNDEVAKVVRRKLEKELADREYRRLVRELKTRSVWRIEKDS